MAAFRGFVVVSGPPASGKSSLAPALAAELDLPLLAKDVIKDALVEVLDAPDLPRSRELGRAAVHVLLAALPGPVVEVFCRCPPALLQQRYAARSTGRGAGYFDLDRDPAELWNAEVGTPVAGGWAVLEVDTAGEVDIAALAARVVAATRHGVG